MERRMGGRTGGEKEMESKREKRERENEEKEFDIVY